MKIMNRSLLTGLFALTLYLNATIAQKSFNNCSAAFLDNKMIVDDYSDRGQCKIAANAKGMLSVCTANLSPTESIPVDKISFMVAIRDHNTKTLVMYSAKSFKQLNIQKVLSQCKVGDGIVLLTQDKQYALPHNEILVQ